MSEQFQFGNYIVRRVDEGDREFLEDLIDKDKYHAGRLRGDDFLKLTPGEDAWAVENERGFVVLYFKTATAVRLLMQFGEEPAETNREVLTLGLPWLESLLAANGFHEIIFDTDGPELRAMARRRLGFKQREELTRLIPLHSLAGSASEPSDRQTHTEGQSDAPSGSVDVWRHTPQTGGEGG
jgi:hypothetical protein